MAELPRVTADVKEGILGRSAVGTFNKQRVQKEVEEKMPSSFLGGVESHSTLDNAFH